MRVGQYTHLMSCLSPCVGSSLPHEKHPTVPTPLFLSRVTWWCTVWYAVDDKTIQESSQSCCFFSSLPSCSLSVPCLCRRHICCCLFCCCYSSDTTSYHTADVLCPVLLLLSLSLFLFFPADETVTLHSFVYRPSLIRTQIQSSSNESNHGLSLTPFLIPRPLFLMDDDDDDDDDDDLHDRCCTCCSCYVCCCLLLFDVVVVKVPYEWNSLSRGEILILMMMMRRVGIIYLIYIVLVLLLLLLLFLQVIMSLFLFWVLFDSVVTTYRSSRCRRSWISSHTIQKVGRDTPHYNISQFVRNNSILYMVLYSNNIQYGSTYK